MSASTIILLTKRRLAQPCPATDDPATQVEAALRLQPKRARRVWILSSDFSTSVLEIPSEMLNGVAAADLGQVLGFEAETLTGAGPRETALAYAPLSWNGRERKYWVTQVNNLVRSQIEDAVRAGGGSVLGMVHPAGVAAPLGASDAAGSWERVEFWDDVVVCLRARGEQAAGPVELLAVPRSTSPTKLAEQIAAFRKDSPPAVWREVWDGAEDGAARDWADESLLTAGDVQHLRAWLEAWAAQLADSAPQVPVLRPAPRPMSPAGRVAIAAGLAACVTLGCFGHARWQRERLAALGAELQRAEAPQQTLESLRQEKGPLAKRHSKLAEEISQGERDADEIREQIERSRHRLARLLEALSASHHDGLLVQRIDGQGGEVRISGLCLQVDGANELAGRLATELKSSGWSVLPAGVTDRPAQSLAGPWEFTIVLSESREQTRE
jgi:hypothetical protein